MQTKMIFAPVAIMAIVLAGQVFAQTKPKATVTFPGTTKDGCAVPGSGKTCGTTTTTTTTTKPATTPK